MALACPERDHRRLHCPRRQQDPNWPFCAVRHRRTPAPAWRAYSAFGALSACSHSRFVISSGHGPGAQSRQLRLSGSAGTPVLPRRRGDACAIAIFVAIGQAGGLCGDGLPWVVESDFDDDSGSSPLRGCVVNDVIPAALTGPLPGPGQCLCASAYGTTPPGSARTRPGPGRGARCAAVPSGKARVTAAVRLDTCSLA
jgi:hypothetical protein